MATAETAADAAPAVAEMGAADSPIPSTPLADPNRGTRALRRNLRQPAPAQQQPEAGETSADEAEETEQNAPEIAPLILPGESLRKYREALSASRETRR